MPAILSHRTVGVMGSGSSAHEELARAVGEAIADLGANLLTGGGGGVMTAASRAYTQRLRKSGICIGILPCASEADRATSKAGYPNAFVELAIRTHLPLSGRRGTDDLSRNHINVLSSDAIVALPGEDGTAAEVSLALRYGRPIIVFSPDAALVARFPQAVRRAERIDEVQQFLRDRLEV